MSELNAPYFRDEDQAREFLEGLRWADGVVCPHCGVIGEHYRLEGQAARKGLWKCKDCRQQFTVTVGTVFERSKVALNKWLLATYLMCASKKGISSLQLSRMLGVTYKTAWFMTHRLREAMKSDNFLKQLGGKDAIVEADETYWGNTRSRKVKKEVGYMHKEKIVSLVERGGNVRSFHVEHVSGETLKPLLKAQVHKDTQIMTDDFGGYRNLNQHFSDHQTVRHTAKEYVRGTVHTNTIEGFFSLLKRGLIGTFHHVGAQHLKRYIAEFDFRYNSRKLTDFERTLLALRGIAGKRLMYTAPSFGRA
jgi:transposase-like protein